jgi:hypothetical protein
MHVLIIKFRKMKLGSHCWCGHFAAANSTSFEGWMGTASPPIAFKTLFMPTKHVRAFNDVLKSIFFLSGKQDSE